MYHQKAIPYKRELNQKRHHLKIYVVDERVKSKEIM
jgi:hypothetical protein